MTQKFLPIPRAYDSVASLNLREKEENPRFEGLERCLPQLEWKMAGLGCVSETDALSQPVRIFSPQALSLQFDLGVWLGPTVLIG